MHDVSCLYQTRASGQVRGVWSSGGMKCDVVKDYAFLHMAEDLDSQSFKANECAWHCTRANFQPPLVWEKTRVAAIGCGKEDHWSKEIKGMSWPTLLSSTIRSMERTPWAIGNPCMRRMHRERSATD